MGCVVCVEGEEKERLDQLISSSDDRCNIKLVLTTSEEHAPAKEVTSVDEAYRNRCHSLLTDPGEKSVLRKRRSKFGMDEGRGADMVNGPILALRL